MIGKVSMGTCHMIQGDRTGGTPSPGLGLGTEPDPCRLAGLQACTGEALRWPALALPTSWHARVFSDK